MTVALFVTLFESDNNGVSVNIKIMRSISLIRKYFEIRNNKIGPGDYGIVTMLGLE